MTKRLMTLTALLAMALLAGCRENPSQDVDFTRVKINIDPLITKATDVNFENGDRLGLTVRRGSTVHAENAEMVYDESASSFVSQDVYWYREPDDASSFTAYYPYSSEGVPTVFTVKEDQSSGITSSDLITSFKDDVFPTFGTVTMAFRHQLTKIAVTIANLSGEELQGVELRGSHLSAAVGVEAGTVEVDSTSATGSILCMPVKRDTVWQAIVIPQTVAFELAVRTVDGKVLSQNLKPLALAQSTMYKISAVVYPDKMKILTSGQIQDWLDGGDIPGEDPVDPPVDPPVEPEPPVGKFGEYLAIPSDDFEEFDGYFVYAGETYKTVTLSNGSTWMAEPMHYLPPKFQPQEDGTALGHIWYPYALDCSQATAFADAVVVPLKDEESIRRLGYLYDYQTALGCAGWRPEDYEDFDRYEGVQGICPAGWHVPTRAEWLDLCGYSNKWEAAGETGAQTNDKAVFFDGSINGGSIFKFNEGGWNFTFSGVRLSQNCDGTGKYQNGRIWTGNSTVEEWYGQPALNYYITSTSNKCSFVSADKADAEHPEGSLSNVAYFTVMTTFTSSAYPTGRVTLVFAGACSGCQLRCVKDKNE